MNGTLETHHPADLALFHKNPRVGDVDAIAGSLRANGQYKPVVVNRGTHTGRPMEVLAGNHTVKAFRQLAEEYPSDDRWQSVDCWVVDVDDDRAGRIVAADNRTSELGGFDDRLLAELLSEFDDLEGTGYDPQDLDDLANMLTLDNENETDADLSRDDFERAEDTGGMLALVDVTIGEPETVVSHGETWHLGRHTLVIAKLMNEHHLWAEHLTEGIQFVPYPEPYITTTDLAEQSAMLLVQPNRYLAGHLIDKHNSAHPDDKAVLA